MLFGADACVVWSLGRRAASGGTLRRLIVAIECDWSHTIAMVESTELTVEAALLAYFERNGFGERGGYDKPWIDVKVLDLIPMRMPNTAGRKAAVLLHDLHHLATGYATDFHGESEIAAFELGGGMAGYVAGIAYNWGAFTLGLVTIPRRTHTAFLRGRVSHVLYREPQLDVENILSDQESALRSRVLGTPKATTWRDELAFTAVAMSSLLAGLALPLNLVVFGCALAWPAPAYAPPTPKSLRA